MFAWPRYVWITLGVILLWLGACVYIQTGDTIYRTPFGYYPDLLRVEVGTTVTFKNLIGGFTWPASDIHPVHTIDSDFDPKRPLGKGESWSYTFSRRGVWSFHDHVASQFTGKVVVYDEIGSTEFDCSGSDKRACWNAAIEEGLKSEGVAGAFSVLKTIHEGNPEFASQCHHYAHDIGLKSYVRYGAEVPFGAEASYCNAGFFHGFMEGYIDSTDNIYEIENFCVSVGNRLGAEFPLAEKQCRHGIGHGILEHYINRYPELVSDPDLLFDKALAVCESLDNEGDDLMRCASGTFNVYRDFVEMSSDRMNVTEESGIFSICEARTQDYQKRACYWEFAKLVSGWENANRIIETAQRDEADDVYELELLVPESDKVEYLGFTTRSWATALGKRAVNDYDSEVVLQTCRHVPARVRSECLRGIYEGAFGSASPGEEYITLTSLCTASQLSLQETSDCFWQFQSDLSQTYTHNLRLAQCAEIPPEFRVGEFCPAT